MVLVDDGRCKWMEFAYVRYLRNLVMIENRVTNRSIKLPDNPTKHGVNLHRNIRSILFIS